MRSAAVAAVSFLAASAFAWAPENTKVARSGSCMGDSDAHEVAEHFQTLIAAYTNASADAYLTTAYTDYSDSVTTLIDGGCNGVPIPLGVPTFTTRDAFEAGQGSQPNITFTILNVWHNCDTVFLRWFSNDPNPDVSTNMFAGKGLNPPEQVTGIVVIETVPNTGSGVPYLIDTVYSEFNSGAWLADLGVFTPSCNSTTTKRDTLPRML